MRNDDRPLPRPGSGWTFTEPATDASALAWPHRIVTLDTVLYDLLAPLLQTGALQWPGGHRELEVLDTWRTTLPTTSNRRKPILSLEGTRIVTSTVWDPERGSHARLDDFTTAVPQGKCTHDNLREVLQLALLVEGVSTSVSGYFDTTIRSLIVDEIYDANDLDVEVIRLAAAGGLNITLVGDPWQALYGFRGARPREMWRFISEHDFTASPLQASMEHTQRQLEGDLATMQAAVQRARRLSLSFVIRVVVCVVALSFLLQFVPGLVLVTGTSVYHHGGRGAVWGVALACITLAVIGLTFVIRKRATSRS